MLFKFNSFRISAFVGVIALVVCVSLLSLPVISWAFDRNKAMENGTIDLFPQSESEGGNRVGIARNRFFFDSRNRFFCLDDKGREILNSDGDSYKINLVWRWGAYNNPCPTVAVRNDTAYIIINAADGAQFGVLDFSVPEFPIFIGKGFLPSYGRGIALSGNYAYVADGYDGLRVIDISDPANPHEVGYYDTGSNAWGVAISGNYAYVADYGDGLRVIDISDPANPHEVGYYDTGDIASSVAISGNYAYVADYRDGLRVIDISDPTDPNEIGFYTTWGYAYDVAISGNYAYIVDGYGLRVIDVSNFSDCHEVGFYDTGGYSYSVILSGNYAYVTAVDVGNGLRVVDVSDPTHPKEVGFCDTGGDAYDVIISGNYAYVACGNSLRVIDVSDPINPHEVGYYDTGAQWVSVSGNCVYVACGYDGLRVVDVSDPANPHEIGYYDTGDCAQCVTVSGNYAYVADMGDGLRVIDISDPTNPHGVGYYDTGGSAWGVTVSGNYAYVGDSDDGLRVIDISDPTNPHEVGFYNTEGYAVDVAVSGSYAYVASYCGGLYILDCRRVDVMLQAFSASAFSDEVRLTWEVSDEVGIDSYRIYRASSGEGRGAVYASIEAAGRTSYQYVDRGVIAGEVYMYTLSAVEGDGTEKVLGDRKVTVGVPSVLYLGQNYPNPFNPSTEIELRLPRAGEVELNVYDLSGRLVARIYSGRETAGVKRYEWDGKDERGNEVPSGVYFYRLRVGKRVLNRKMVLVR